MRTAVDSSVVLDVLLDDPRHAASSEASLREAAQTGALVVCECVLAEIRPAFQVGEIEAFLSDWDLGFVPSTRESSLLAGKMFRSYLDRRRAARNRVVADFLIGAHAQLLADRLVARDRGYYRDYFKSLELVEPRG